MTKDLFFSSHLGDPHSPALFNLGGEMLYISINGLPNHHDCHGIFMEGRPPSFTDDTIMFTSGNPKLSSSSCKLSKNIMIHQAS